MKFLKHKSLFAIFIVGIFSMLILSVNFTEASGDKFKNPAEKIDEQIKGYVESEGFQGTILVAQNGKIIHQAAYGFADREKKIKNTVKTQFQIGSLTKSFTAIAALKLVEDGILDLNAPIKKYIPDLKDELANGLTLHYLLKNQSGLVPSFDSLTDYENKDLTPKELLAIINKSSRDFKPGERYQYSNLGFNLCAIAMENATGKSSAEILHERIFKPLKMNATGVERVSNYPKDRAKGYQKNAKGTTNIENDVSYALGTGDIYSTVEDLFKWEQALYDGKLLSEKSKKLLFDGGNEEFGYYGYGFRIQPYQRNPGIKTNGILTRHGGTMDGFMSNFHHYLDDDLTVIVLGNIRPFPIRKMTFEIKEIALGVEPGKRNNSKLE